MNNVTVPQYKRKSGKAQKRNGRMNTTEYGKRLKQVDGKFKSKLK